MHSPNSNTTNNSEGNNSKPHRPKITEGTYFRSQDGLVSVGVKIASAKRYPQHDYPICVLRLIPRKATRVQSLEGPEGGVEYLAPFDELRKWLETIALADDKFTFTLNKAAQPKPQERKEEWRRRNHERFGRR
jgi:hypothetical protein